MEPVAGWFDEFFSPVHHLSGPNTYAFGQTALKITVCCRCTYPGIHFQYACRFITEKLAHMLEHLVRVPRWAERDHAVRNEHQELKYSNVLSLQTLGV